MIAFPGGLSAQPQDICTDALETAEEQYQEGAYEEARRVVTACLNQEDVPEDQVVAAYRLLALIHLRQDQLQEARSAIVNLLGVRPDYEPDEVESPPSYVSLVSVVKEDLESGELAEEEPEEGADEETPFFQRRSTWLTIGGIVIGSGVATYFTVGPGGSDGEGPGSDALPLPPSEPN